MRSTTLRTPPSSPARPQSNASSSSRASRHGVRVSTNRPITNTARPQLPTPRSSLSSSSSSSSTGPSNQRLRSLQEQVDSSDDDKDCDLSQDSRGQQQQQPQQQPSPPTIAIDTDEMERMTQTAMKSALMLKQTNKNKKRAATVRRSHGNNRPTNWQVHDLGPQVREFIEQNPINFGVGTTNEGTNINDYNVFMRKVIWRKYFRRAEVRSKREMINGKIEPVWIILDDDEQEAWIDTRIPPEDRPDHMISDDDDNNNINNDQLHGEVVVITDDDGNSSVTADLSSTRDDLSTTADITE